MSMNKILASLTYIKENLKYRDKLAENYKQEEEMMTYCPLIAQRISLNLFRRLVADHIMRCKNLHSGSSLPKASAFLLLFSEIYLKIATDNFYLHDEKVNEGDFLVILIAIV